MHALVKAQLRPSAEKCRESVLYGTENMIVGEKLLAVQSFAQQTDKCCTYNEVTQTNVKTHTDLDSMDCFHIVKGSRHMKVKGLIEGTPLEWQIDTGAVKTFIMEDTYYNILPENRPALEHV